MSIVYRAANVFPSRIVGEDGIQVVTANGIATLSLSEDTILAGDIGSLVQAYDADLSAIAALTTTSFGRGLLTLANQAALLSAAGAQAADSDLTAIAALTTTTFGRSLLTQADAAAARTTLGVQPLDSDLTAIAALTTTTFGRSLLTLADAAALLTAAGGQPLDSDLTAIAALSTQTYGRSLLTAANAAALRVLAGGIPYVIYTNAVRATHTGDTSLTVLRSFTLPGGSLGPNGFLRFHLEWAMGSGGTNTDATTVGLRVGGTNLVAASVANTNRSMIRNGIWRARNSQASQVTRGSTTTADSGVSTLTPTTTTVDLTVDQTVEVCVTLANAADTSYVDAVTFEVFYGA